MLRLRALYKRRQLDRDLEDEMQFHLAMREEKYRAGGMAPGEAQAAARRQFGSPTRIRELCRDLWTFVWLETFGQDIRYGLRQLRRTPGFTVVAAVTLALGVGGTTAIYSLFDTVLWRPMAAPNLRSLVVVAQALPGQPHFFGPASVVDLEDIQRTAVTFEGLALFMNTSVNLVDAGGDAVRVEATRVAPDFFQVAGALPALGRTFAAAEERVVLLSDDLWRKHFDADRTIVGRTIRVDGRNCAVIGVMPPEFTLPRVNRKLWLPLSTSPEERSSRSALSVMAMGRLKPGQTVRQAAIELEGIAARPQKAYPETNRDRRFVAWTYQRFFVGDYVPIYEGMLAESLKEGGRSSASSRGRARLRSALVAGELALAVVLLVGAGLMVRGFRSLVAGGSEMDPTHMLTVRVSLTENQYREPWQFAAFYREVLDRVSALPGVRSAVVVTALPFSRFSYSLPAAAEGSLKKPEMVQEQAVSPGYFRALNIPLLSGTAYVEGTRSVVISQAMARRWSLEPGRRIQLRPPDGPWLTIGGIVGDVQQSVLSHDAVPTLYVSYQQFARREMDIGVRTAGDPIRLAPAVTAAIRAVDREQPFSNVNTLATLIYQEAFVFAYVAALMGIFGLVALGLSATGVYGVMSYVVSQQQHEIGVRMALGAPRGSVLAMLLRRGMRTAAIGLLIGAIPAYGLARLMRATVWGVTLRDPATFVAIPLGLLAAAALAIYFPARRGTRIDPILALGDE